jgi:hypothetical protein
MPTETIERTAERASQHQAETKAKNRLNDSIIFIPDTFLKALARTKLAGSRRRLLDALMIEVWNRPRKEGAIPIQQLMELTGLSKSTLLRARLELVRLGVIRYTRTNTKEGAYRIEDNPEKWGAAPPVTPEPSEISCPEEAPRPVEASAPQALPEPPESLVDLIKHPEEIGLIPDTEPLPPQPRVNVTGVTHLVSFLTPEPDAKNPAPELKNPLAESVFQIQSPAERDDKKSEKKRRRSLPRRR